MLADSELVVLVVNFNVAGLLLLSIQRGPHGKDCTPTWMPILHNLFSMATLLLVGSSDLGICTRSKALTVKVPKLRILCCKAINVKFDCFAVVG